ncbi:hypothetical protein KKA53_02385 [Candidatus Dependentiae bacterium]|nr:hypothetical protein [Candidatus Dependentiae bacterium]
MSFFVRLFVLLISLVPSLDALVRNSQPVRPVRQQPIQVPVQGSVTPRVVTKSPVVRKRREEIGLELLRRLEIEVWQNQNLGSLEKLNKSCFEKLLSILRSCPGVTLGDQEIIKTISESLSLFYNYKLNFPEIERDVYPFRSTISHIALMTSNKASERALEEKIREFSSVSLALKLTFESAGEGIKERFLCDNFVHKFQELLLSMVKGDGQPISFGKQDVMQSQNQIQNQLQTDLEQQKASRSFIGKKGKWLLAILGLCGTAWLGKRYVVDPIRRYRIFADTANKVLEKIKDKSPEVIVTEGIKAVAQLPENQQTRAFEVFIKAARENGYELPSTKPAESLKLSLEALGKLPEEEQKKLIGTVVNVFGLNFDKNPLGGKTFTEIRDEAEKLLEMYSKYKKVEGLANRVAEGGKNLLGRAWEWTSNLFVADNKGDDTDKKKTAVDECEQSSENVEDLQNKDETDVQKVIAEVNSQEPEEEGNESDDDDDDDDDYEDFPEEDPVQDKDTATQDEDDATKIADDVVNGQEDEKSSWFGQSWGWVKSWF